MKTNQNILQYTVLSQILFSPEVLDWLETPIDPDYFSDPKLRVIMQAIRRLQAEDQQVSLMSVMEILQAEKTGISASELMEMSSSVRSSMDFVQNVDILYREHLSRATQQILQQDVNSLNVYEVTGEVVGKLEDLNATDRRAQLQPIAEDVARLRTQVERARQTDQPITGIATGLTRLDELLLGLQQGELTILAARPSVGKSAMALTMMYNIAHDSGIPVALFSLEMSRNQLVRRLMMRHARIDGTHLRSGRLTADEQNRLDTMQNEVAQLPIYINDISSLYIEDLGAMVKRAVTQYGVRVVFVDYLQLMRAKVNRQANREQEVSAISRGLKAIAKRYNISVVALAQLNREYEKAKDKAPQLSDLRESGSLEQDADVVLLLWRKPIQREDMQGFDAHTIDDSQRILTLAKQREGPIGSMELHFCANQAYFGEVASQNQQAQKEQKYQHIQSTLQF